MKVLYLLRYFPTLTETFVYREIDGLRRLGVEVEVASLGARADGRLQDELPAVAVHRVPRRSLRGRLSAEGPGQQRLRELRGPKEAARLPWLAARVGDVDRIHAHFAGGAAEWAQALALELGVPYSVTVHAVDLFRPRPSLGAVLQGAQVVVSVAEHHLPLLAGHGVQAAVVRCGPELSQWALGPPPAGPLRALAIGRDVPKKGFDLLLDAWAGLDRPDATLTLVSDRPDPGLPGVRCTGLLPPPGVRAEMARANLVVLPCRRAPDGDMDGIPVALMEGLAASRPVITTAISGISELVDDAVGWLLPDADADATRAALREALHAAHDRADLRTARGAKGPARLTSRGFTADAQAQGLLNCWLAPGS